MSGSDGKIDYDTYQKLINFLAYVGNGWVEMSHDKIKNEYLWMKSKGRELYLELSPPFKPDMDEEYPAKFDDNF